MSCADPARPRVQTAIGDSSTSEVTKALGGCIAPGLPAPSAPSAPPGPAPRTTTTTTMTPATSLPPPPPPLHHCHRHPGSSPDVGAFGRAEEMMAEVNRLERERDELEDQQTKWDERQTTLEENIKQVRQPTRLIRMLEPAQGLTVKPPPTRR